MVDFLMRIIVHKENILNVFIIKKVCYFFNRVSIRTLSLYYLAVVPNAYGMLLSRSCPATLRYNDQADRCDYAENVKCIHG